MKNHQGFLDFFGELYSLNPRNNEFVIFQISLFNYEQSKTGNFFLMNNPRTYAVLTYLTQLQAIKQETEESTKEELYGLAKQSQDRNKQKDMVYTEILMDKMIDNPRISSKDVVKYLEHQKLRISDFNYVAASLIQKIQPVKSSLLKKKYLKRLFDKTPWCLVTMKTLCRQYSKKMKEKPANILQMFSVLIKYLEYKDDGGHLEQWHFLQSKNTLDTWERVILGANLLKQIQTVVYSKRDELEIFEQELEKLKSNENYGNKLRQNREN
ncbi:UNKNOWN [Stylonychia lemnae]|uniref:Uncharacterized protein n=1 Tax=Stylonychia lemnae TaxID=5949 RepID=A0A077ZT23_STYLE|nr:UNKNOWN [Stylonychia lemnae]|eukprot:CDW72460.1 UNKNOWN [Stylonychia lemnae]